MNTINGYVEFKKLMANFMKNIFKKESEHPDFFSTQNSIEFLIFNGFREISDSLDTLKLIELFIKTNPPKKME